MKLVMTLLVRDSEALLRENLEFHLQQGVDHFIITDNRSTDGTSRIIEEYAAAGLAERIWEPEDTFSQGRWVTRMARRAAMAGADWIINSDDDEKTAFIQLGEGDRQNSYDGTSEGEKNGGGEPFTPPYDYELEPAAEVPDAIMAGAGPH